MPGGRVCLGIAIIHYSLFTDYELGLLHAIPLPVRLIIDGLDGLVPAASPWIVGFADTVWVPHRMLGGLEIVVARVPDRVPSDERGERHPL